MSLLSPFGKAAWPIIWKKNELFSKFCIKLGWYGPSGSVEEDENMEKKPRPSESYLSFELGWTKMKYHVHNVNGIPDFQNWSKFLFEFMEVVKALMIYWLSAIVKTNISWHRRNTLWRRI